MAIWEPCNYVSNLAYDRLVLEMCNQVNFISLDYELLGNKFFKRKTGLWEKRMSKELLRHLQLLHLALLSCMGVKQD